MEGYIKLSRKLFANGLWNEARTYSRFEAWIDLIQSARFERRPEYISVVVGGREVSYTRGQIPASIRFLMRRWNWSMKKVRAYLITLEKNKMITVHKDHGMNIITLCNYDLYNQTETDDVTTSNTYCDTTNSLNNSNLSSNKAHQVIQSREQSKIQGRKQGTNTIKENNKETLSIERAKKTEFSLKEPVRKKFDLSFVEPEYESVFLEWLTYKKAKGKSYKTQHSLELCYKKLKERSGNNPEVAREMVETSEANNWDGFFERKEYGESRTSEGNITKTEADRRAVEALAYSTVGQGTGMDNKMERPF